MEFDFNTIKDLQSFLQKFNISEKEINNFTEGKKIFKIKDDIFLINEEANFDNNEVYRDNIICIQLRELAPSTYLLKFIKKYGNVYEEESYNKATKFTYGKDLQSQNAKQGFYLINHKDLILGLGEIKQNRITNIFNVGRYLKER